MSKLIVKSFPMFCYNDRQAYRTNHLTNYVYVVWSNNKQYQ